MELYLLIPRKLEYLLFWLCFNKPSQTLSLLRLYFLSAWLPNFFIFFCYEILWNILIDGYHTFYSKLPCTALIFFIKNPMVKAVYMCCCRHDRSRMFSRWWDAVLQIFTRPQLNTKWFCSQLLSRRWRWRLTDF